MAKITPVTKDKGYGTIGDHGCVIGRSVLTFRSPCLNGAFRAPLFWHRVLDPVWGYWWVLGGVTKWLRVEIIRVFSHRLSCVV